MTQTPPSSLLSKAKASAPAFTTIAPYYDFVMRDVPYRRWKEYVLRLVDRHGGGSLLRRNRAVLDAACGTGTLALMFAADGYQVTAVDISAAMIEEARRKSVTLQIPLALLIQDVAELSVEPSRYALCISLFDSLNYVTVPARLHQAFLRIHDALVPGGFFIFDLNTPLALRSHMFDQEDLNPQEPVRYRWRSTYDERTCLCTVRMEFWIGSGAETSKCTEIHVQRAYEHAEVLQLLEEAGFQFLEALEAYTFDPLRPTTDRVFYIAQRPET